MVDLQRLTPLLRYICVCGSARGAKRGSVGVGGCSGFEFMTGYLTISSIGPPGISLFTAHTVYIITTPNWSHVGAFLFLSVCLCERSIMGRVQQNQRVSTVERKIKEEGAKDKRVG